MPADPPTRSPRRSQRIGRYEVVTHLATGGMGAVYKARDLETGRDVALKVLPPDLAANPKTLARFHSEAAHAAKLSYKHIVTLYEFNESDGIYFLALEFVDGIDLHEYISRKGRLEPREALQILYQGAKALRHAHEQGVVHRDIKPSNFLITMKDDKPFVKLTDLGLAVGENEDDFRITRAGTTVGTVDYMSPEQARNSRSADIRSDIYSLGCTFYHMLAGNAPFDEGTLTERIFKHAQDAPPDVRKINPRVPRWLAGVLNKMLAKKPDDRYQTPAQLIAALRQQGEEAPATAPQGNWHEVLSGLAHSAESAEDLAANAPAELPRPPARKRRRPPEETRELRLSKTQTILAFRAWWPWALVGLTTLLLASGILVILLRGQ